LRGEGGGGGGSQGVVLLFVVPVLFLRPRFHKHTPLSLSTHQHTPLDQTRAIDHQNSPEGYLGELETWDKAEAALTEALNSTGREWTINEADGAFYGPKIDITVYDALRRKFQCATVQLDFQMPIR
jgi:threonyl-tRNA synthetase